MSATPRCLTCGNPLDRHDLRNGYRICPTCEDVTAAASAAERSRLDGDGTWDGDDR